jgi:hypothetical protein
MDHETVQKQSVKILVPLFDGDENKYLTWRWKIGLNLLPFGLKPMLSSESYTGNKDELEFHK